MPHPVRVPQNEDNYALARLINGDVPMAMVQTRNVHDVNYVDHFCVASAYWDEAEEASDLEVESYLNKRQIEMLSDVDDTPEPIAVHDQDIWQECVAGEYDDFVHEFNDITFADAA